jgi:hypothetical protein
MMTSSDQKGKSLKEMNFTPNKDPPEGKTTAIVAVMRGRPKRGHHRQCSNKHYKRKLVRVLLNSGSDGDLIFIDKDKPGGTLQGAASTIRINLKEPVRVWPAQPGLTWRNPPGCGQHNQD